MAEKYQCTLTKESLEKAKEELSEDPKERMSAVDTFRTWIVSQPHIKCPTDTGYLLRFLRRSYFSQLEARKVLEKFLTVKTSLPKWMSGIDPTCSKTQALLKSGWMLPLPGFTDEGRKVIMIRQFQIDHHTKAYDNHTALNAYFMILYYFIFDENIQVNGFELINEFTGVSSKHPMWLGVDNLKKMLSAIQGSMPIRVKRIHHYNTGPVFETVFALIRPILSTKFQERMIVHGSNLESVYKRIPMRLLPSEYLPDEYDGPSAGSAQSILDNFIKDLNQPATVQRLKEESKLEYGIDESKRPVKAVQESFRKLNVD